MIILKQKKYFIKQFINKQKRKIMKKVLVGAMALLALAACSNEEVLDQNQVRNEIGFTAVTGKALSRAADGFCNGKLPDDFQVWAKQGTTDYIKGQTFTKSGSIYSTNPARYWPSGNLDFFAAKNFEGATATPASVTWNASAASPAIISNFIVENDVTKQHDFIYAVNMGQAKPTGGAAAPLNFRHGLAQVVFRAQNLNKNISIEVTGVKVMNVQNKGTFTFPTASTTGNVVDEDNPQNTSLAGKQQGSWAVETGSLDSYTVTFPTVKVTQNNSATEPVSLTYDFKSSTERYNAGSLYLMEQNGTELWNGTADLMASGAYKTDCGAYLILTCSIWNVAAGDGSERTGSDVCLWENKDIAVKLPAALAWKHGYKYVYTFKFTTDGNGGTDPGTLDPVFTPIELSVTVDDFANETETPVDMVKP